MKRTGRAVMLVFVLLMGLVLVNAGTTVSYADTFFTEGDFRYAVTTGDKVLLAGYNGDSMDVILPEGWTPKPRKHCRKRHFNCIKSIRRTPRSSREPTPTHVALLRSAVAKASRRFCCLLR